MTYRGVKLTNKNNQQKVKPTDIVYRGVKVKAYESPNSPKMTKGIYRGTDWVA